jgi:RND family efflux transporter MFP subunit
MDIILPGGGEGGLSRRPVLAENSKTVSNRAAILYSRFVLLSALLAPTACSRSQGAAPDPSRSAARGIAVRVAPVAVQDVVYRIQSLGSLEAEEMVQVTAEVEGAVAEVRFHEGDRVTPQTVLVRIDPDRYRLEAERADATYQRALADQRRAEADLARRRELDQQQLVAPEELNRSEQETARLAAEALASKAAWEIAVQNLRKAEVRPARAGVINTRSVDTGQFVKTGVALATLVDTSRLRLRFKISEKESLRVKEADTVSFRVAALGANDFTARIYHVGEVADPTTRQVEVAAWVKNTGQLKPGFFAEVTVATESHQGALVVPEAAVQASERGFITYVVDGDKVRLKTIQVGLRSGTGVIEVLSGLEAGQTVVTEGSDRLADGVAVQVATGPAGPAASAPTSAGRKP